MPSQGLTRGGGGREASQDRVSPHSRSSLYSGAPPAGVPRVQARRCGGRGRGAACGGGFPAPQGPLELPAPSPFPLGLSHPTLDPNEAEEAPRTNHTMLTQREAVQPWGMKESIRGRVQILCVLSCVTWEGFAQLQLKNRLGLSEDHGLTLRFSSQDNGWLCQRSPF